ncbi:MAG: hypothetical protein B1H11_12940 [Desulfobacteraceae bacterium 4484_190.1]|nr:MAG: hypothetical protein B1H11_12940 [Desulfobacteraceae bacterium 4484_190.1]
MIKQIYTISCIILFLVVTGCAGTKVDIKKKAQALHEIGNSLISNGQLRKRLFLYGQTFRKSGMI